MQLLGMCLMCHHLYALNVPSFQHSPTPHFMIPLRAGSRSIILSLRPLGSPLTFYMLSCTLDPCPPSSHFTAPYCQFLAAHQVLDSHLACPCVHRVPLCLFSRQCSPALSQPPDCFSAPFHLILIPLCCHFLSWALSVRQPHGVSIRLSPLVCSANRACLPSPSSLTRACKL